MTKLISKILPLFFIAIVAASCTQSGEQKEVLAKINDLEVTKAHFESAFKRYYYKTGQVLEPNFATKSSVLDTEFNVYVLATYARELGLSNDREANRQYGIIQRKVFSEEYLNHEVLSNVEVTENDVREVFFRFNTKLRASHLYAPDKESALKLYERLQNGESFEKLAAESFENPYLAKNGGDIGEFTIDEMDIAFENTAFDLKVGEISEPVKTKQGYSIIKLTDRFTTPIITEFQYASRKNQFKDFAYQRNEELATRNHIEQVLEQLNVDEELIDRLWVDVQNNQGGSLDLNPEQNLLQLKTSISDNELLAQYGDYTFAISDLKKEGFYSPQENLNRIDREHRFQSFVKGIIYRDYINNQFSKLPASESKTVQGSIKQTFLNYLSNRVDEVLKAQIELTNEELIEEFHQNKSMYDFPLRMNLARIVVESEERGKEVMQSLKHGKSWDEVLRTYTIDTRDLMVNGELGLKPIQEYGAHAFHVKDLKEGEVDGPFAYQSGKFMIYKVIEVKEPREAKYEEVSDLVSQVLLQKKLKQLRKELIEDTKDRYNAVLNYDKLKALNIKL